MVTLKRKNNRTLGAWTAACIGLSISLMFPAYGGFGKKQDGVAPSAIKISPVLRDEVDFLSKNPEYDYPVPVIVQVDPGVLSAPSGKSSGSGRGLRQQPRAGTRLSVPSQGPRDPAAAALSPGPLRHPRCGDTGQQEEKQQPWDR